MANKLTQKGSAPRRSTWGRRSRRVGANKRLDDRFLAECKGLSAAPPLSVELTRFTSHGQSLSKRIRLDTDGNVVSEAGRPMSEGRAERLTIRSAAELAEHINACRPDQAFSVAALRDGLPDGITVVKKANLQTLIGGGTPAISRSAGNLVYEPGKPAFVLLDIDTKGMTEDVQGWLTMMGGFEAALVSTLPQISTAMRVVRRSTSAALYRTDTGAPLPDAGGLHIYIGITDGTDAKRFLQVLHDRVWLAGFGWVRISRGGELLERSIVDRSVHSPERLIFEGQAELASPLAQDVAARRPIAIEGCLLDTRTALPDLDAKARAELRQRIEAAKQALAPAAAIVWARRTGERIADLVARGISPEVARIIAEAHSLGMLHPEVVLPWDDTELAGHTVGDVLADPEAYLGKSLADPLDPWDGQGKAMILRRPTGALYVNSFCHGGRTFDLAPPVNPFHRSIPPTVWLWGWGWVTVQSEVLPAFQRIRV